MNIIAKENLINEAKANLTETNEIILNKITNMFDSVIKDNGQFLRSILYLICDYKQQSAGDWLDDFIGAMSEPLESGLNWFTENDKEYGWKFLRNYIKCLIKEIHGVDWNLLYS